MLKPCACHLTSICDSSVKLLTTSNQILTSMFHLCHQELDQLSVMTCDSYWREKNTLTLFQNSVLYIEGKLKFGLVYRNKAKIVLK